MLPRSGLKKYIGRRIFSWIQTSPCLSLWTLGTLGDQPFRTTWRRYSAQLPWWSRTTLWSAKSCFSASAILKIESALRRWWPLSGFVPNNSLRRFVSMDYFDHKKIQGLYGACFIGSTLYSSWQTGYLSCILVLWLVSRQHVTRLIHNQNIEQLLLRAPEQYLQQHPLLFWFGRRTTTITVCAL